MARKLLLLVAAVAAGCSTTRQPTTAKPADSAPASSDIAKLFDRELAPLPKHKVASHDGTITGEVEAAQAPKGTVEDGMDSWTIPLGTAYPMSCVVHNDRLDAGSAIWKMSKSFPEPYSFKGLQSTQVEHVAGSPLIAVDLLYGDNSPKPKVGLVKMAVYTHADHSLLCLHDEVGYTASFRRIVKELAASLASSAQAKAGRPFYSEVQIIKLGEIPVGFTERQMRDEKGGKRSIEERSTMLMLRSNTDLIAQDMLTQDEVDSAGNIEHELYVRVSNGEILSRLELQRMKKGRYHYEGTADKKAVKGTFDAKAPLASDLAITRTLREKLVKGKAQRVQFTHYAASVNPAGTLQFSFRKDPSRPRGVIARLGPMELNGTLDEQGLVEQIEYVAGGASFKEERIYADGTL